MNAEEVFGKIEFLKNSRARVIRVRIKADGLIVTLPLNSTSEQALQFINSKQKSILSKQQKLILNERNNPLLLSEMSVLQTLTFKVVLNRCNRNDLYFSMKEGTLRIEFPEKTDCNSKQTQHYFWNGINYFLKKEAKRLLYDRTKQLAAKHGFTFADVKIQSSKSRWGSCSRHKNINLSFYLMLLPAHLIDYVILHELCHTREMNHGIKFWQWMDKVTDNKSKILRSELKSYNMP